VLRFENRDGVSVLSVEPTVSTCGYDAGYCGGLPRWNSLPAAATTSAPLRTAPRIASSSACEAIEPERLRLMTVRPYWPATATPRMTSLVFGPSAAVPTAKMRSAAVG